MEVAYFTLSYKQLYIRHIIGVAIGLPPPPCSYAYALCYSLFAVSAVVSICEICSDL